MTKEQRRRLRSLYEAAMAAAWDHNSDEMMRATKALGEYMAELFNIAAAGGRSQ